MIILLRKIKDLNIEGEKKVRITWSHTFAVIPTMIGHTIVVHNGPNIMPLALNVSCRVPLRSKMFFGQVSLQSHAKGNNNYRKVQG